jgi:hypothetical protein
LPQRPQLFGSALRFEHPEPQQVSEAPHVGVHAQLLPTWHVPAQQTVPAAQTFPHPPQFLLSSCVSLHALLQQVSPFWQSLPHLPQFSESLLRFVQPAPQHDSLSPHVGVHAHDAPTWQVPAQQMEPAAQTFPHPPQFLPSSCVSLHPPLQHVSPLPQALPHLPQFSESLDVLVHPAPQHVWFRPHVGVQAQLLPTWQVPAQQIEPAAQTLPHAPQFLLSSCMSLHVLLQQESPLPQTLPHLPQLSGSPVRFAQPEPQHVSLRLHVGLHAHVVPTWHTPPAEPPPAVAPPKRTLTLWPES